MSLPSPRPKYNFKDVSKENPLLIRIDNGDRKPAMKALRAAYAWGKRHNVVMFGETESMPEFGGGLYMVIRTHP